MTSGIGTPSVVRSVVQFKANYRAYVPELRYDFWFSCAYCTITEAEACGITFEVDHYSPQVGGNLINVNVYSNLMWCCSDCNGLKSNFEFSPALQAKGYRFVRPDQDCFLDHFELNGIQLKPKTEPARFTHRILRLDRAVLRRIRELREQIYGNSALLVKGLSELKSRRMDSLNTEGRLRFEDAKKTAIGAVARLKEEIIEASDVRKLSASPLPVFQPVDKDQNKARRDYLAEIKALAAE